VKTNHLILRTLRRSLERGSAVQVDGLGVFRPAPGGGYQFVAESRPRVFIAYAQEDLAAARRICRELKTAGCAPWLDKQQLMAGQNWPRAIRRAIEISDAFIACFSQNSVQKKGQFQRELRHALRFTTNLPLESTFIIPVRLELCELPRILAGQTQYVDLFPDWKRGIRRLIRALRQIQAVRRW
jgi:hypothetical protein